MNPPPADPVESTRPSPAGANAQADCGKLDLRSGLIAGGFVVAAFLLRLWQASGTFLNPDEAMHVQAAWQPTLAAAYRASLGLAHPPLLILVLNVWRKLGSSELMLRLSSVIAGTAFCWVLFQWLWRRLGRTTAWLGLIFACFLPSMIQLSAEVRQYGLLLCFLMLAAYWLELALERGSVLWMALSAVSLYLAMLSHFSGILLAGALGIYGLLRLLVRRYRSRVIVGWMAAQAGALTLLSFLYRTQISQLRGSGVERRVMRSMLASSYFHWGEGHWALFVLARSFGVFQFTFGQLVVGDLAALVFLAGAVWMLRGKGAEEEKATPWWMGVLLLLPFAITCAAGLTDFYPYGGTRHSALLVPFALAGVSFGLARLMRSETPFAAGVAVVVVAACAVFGHPHRPYMPRGDQKSANMTAAIAFLKQNVGADDRILVDFQTNFPLRFYLCHESVQPLDSNARGFNAFSCDGKTVIAAGPGANNWDRDMFLRHWDRVVKDYALTRGQNVWVVQMGWDVNLARQLRELPELRDLAVQSFGGNISIFKLTVGRPMPLDAGGP